MSTSLHEQRTSMHPCDAEVLARLHLSPFFTYHAPCNRRNLPGDLSAVDFACDLSAVDFACDLPADLSAVLAAVALETVGLGAAASEASGLLSSVSDSFTDPSTKCVSNRSIPNTQQQHLPTKTVWWACSTRPRAHHPSRVEGSGLGQVPWGQRTWQGCSRVLATTRGVIIRGARVWRRGG